MSVSPIETMLSENSTFTPTARHLHLVAPPPSSAATLFRPEANLDWFRDIASKIEEVAALKTVSPRAAVRCMTWLMTVAAELVLPDISIGDDESILLEWESQGGLLSVLFDDRGDEWYFEDADGAEVEQRVGARQDLLADALELVAVVSHPVESVHN